MSLPFPAMQTPRHRIERTQNKHSRAFIRDNTIIIRLARRLNREEERRHIDHLLERMRAIAQEERKKTLIDPFRALLDGQPSDKIRLGNGKTFAVKLQPGARTAARRKQGGWNVEISPQIRRRALHHFLWNILSSQEKTRMEKLVHDINAATSNVRIANVKLRFASTQWGSCSSKGGIMLNTALLFLPVSLLRYVIIHELAHRKHANHSDAYWAEVERMMPRYRRSYEELKRYRLASL